MSKKNMAFSVISSIAVISASFIAGRKSMDKTIKYICEENEDELDLLSYELEEVENDNRILREQIKNLRGDN